MSGGSKKRISRSYCRKNAGIEKFKEKNVSEVGYLLGGDDDYVGDVRAGRRN